MIGNVFPCSMKIYKNLNESYVMFFDEVVKYDVVFSIKKDLP